MNRYLKASVASLFAVSLIAGGAIGANASGKDKGPTVEERKAIDENTTGSVGNNTFMSNDTLGTWEKGNLNVVAVSTLNDVDPNKTLLMNRMTANPDEVAALQTAIQNNAALKAQLMSQNVQLQNIVAAVQGADGGVTFYVQ